MYFADPERFKHFIDVFDTVSNMSVSKNYYHTDLFNIEEILSILEMREQLGGKKISQSFLQYIADVVQHFTPPVQDSRVIRDSSSDWWEVVFADDQLQQGYGYFVASLLNLSFQSDISLQQGSAIRKFNCTKLVSPPISYSVITLNYDLVLESFARYIKESFHISEDFGFARDIDSGDNHAAEPPYLAKLHGSVDTGIIVPPTWNKTLNEQLLPGWRLAFKLLVEANHIRIIGYSLPTADTYVKYLLKAAIIEAARTKANPHLKSIDIFCLDNDGQIRHRYNEFFDFYKYRFINAGVEFYGVEFYLYSNYLMYKHRATPNQTSPLDLDKLEATHEKFFKDYAKKQ